jgi:hypothetical protein
MKPYGDDKFEFLTPAYSVFDGTSNYDPNADADFTLYLLENLYASPTSCSDLADCVVGYSREKTVFIEKILPSADYLLDDRRLEIYYYTVNSANTLQTLIVASAPSLTNLISR